MDPELRASIERDNELEDAGMHGDDRRTCWMHRTWAEDCEDLHTRPVTTLLSDRQRHDER